MVTIRSRPVHLIEPSTFMNDSGLAVSAILQETDIPLQDIIVLVDDIHLDMGRIRIRRRGSDGGHNGLRSVISILSDDGFARVRLGVGEVPVATSRIDYVLRRFEMTELQQAKSLIRRGVDAVRSWCADGVETTMNSFNGR